MYGLPEHCDELDLKKNANVKHVISTEITLDNMKGICKGDGRIKIRLNDGETEQQVRQNLRKAGYMVENHVEDSRKRPHFTGGPKEEKIANSNSKAHELMSKDRGLFGHSEN